jgi:hypothetical protein
MRDIITYSIKEKRERPYKRGRRKTGGWENLYDALSFFFNRIHYYIFYFFLFSRGSRPPHPCLKRTPKNLYRISFASLPRNTKTPKGLSPSNKELAWWNWLENLYRISFQPRACANANRSENENHSQQKVEAKKAAHTRGYVGECVLLARLSLERVARFAGFLFALYQSIF